MNHPCEKQQVIDMIYEELKEVKKIQEEGRKDIVKLVEFRSSAMAIIATITIGCNVLAWSIPILFSWWKK